MENVFEKLFVYVCLASQFAPPKNLEEMEVFLKELNMSLKRLNMSLKRFKMYLKIWKLSSKRWKTSLKNLNRSLSKWKIFSLLRVSLGKWHMTKSICHMQNLQRGGRCLQKNGRCLRSDEI